MTLQRRAAIQTAGRYALALGALRALAPTEANAMDRMCLFSAVHGVVLDHGKPVAGATIERSYNWGWNDQSGGDQTTTDAQGAFALPAIWGRSLLGAILPHEPVIEQTILIKYAGRTWKAWMKDKHNYHENGELAGLDDDGKLFGYDASGKLVGRPISLVCRLEAELKRRSTVYGICEPQ